MDEIQKTCSKCNYTFPISNFQKVPRNKSGFSGQCNKCLNKYKHEWKYKNYKKFQETQRAYSQRTKQQRNEYNRKWRKTNKEKYRKTYTTRNKQKYKLGVCNQCKNSRFLDSPMCLDHGIYNRIRLIYRKTNQQFNRENTLKLTQQLKEKLPENLICTKIGLPFIKSTELHLDHIEALCYKPELALEVSNLQWTHKLYNYHKRDLTDIEYLEHCKKILQIQGYGIIVPNQ